MKQALDSGILLGAIICMVVYLAELIRRLYGADVAYPTLVLVFAIIGIVLIYLGKKGKDK